MQSQLRRDLLKNKSNGKYQSADFNQTYLSPKNLNKKEEHGKSPFYSG